VNVNAPEKRFDCTLSLSSADLTLKINAVKDSLRMKGLDCYGAAFIIFIKSILVCNAGALSPGQGRSFLPSKGDL
jgi:hypothetical protein